MVSIWGPPVLVAGIIFILSSIPGNDYPGHPEIANVAVHFTEFAVLAFLLARAFRQTGMVNGTAGTIFYTTLVCLSYGFLDELHQFVIPYRVFDTVDIMVDALGALAGSAVLVIYIKNKPGGAGFSEEQDDIPSFQKGNK